MEASDPDFDQVRKYLYGEMDEDEKLRFENLINNDPEFAQQVNLDQVLLEGIQLHYRGQLKQKLQSLDKVNTPVVRPFSPVFKAIAIAASVMLIMVVGFLIFESRPDTRELYTTYFKPYYNVVSDIERGEIMDQNQEDPFRLYESGHYESASELFEKLLVVHPDNYELILYNGLSYLNSGSTTRAIYNLSKAADKEDFPLSVTAQWYLGLAFLKENDVEQAIDTFTSLVKKDSGYADRSKEILKALK